MKTLWSKIASLALCATILCAVSAAALTAEPSAGPELIRVWGTVKHLENGELFLKNSNEEDPYHEFVLRMDENTAVVDAASGAPLDPSSIRDGETVYAWALPTVTASLPPKSTAAVIVAHIPADFGAPQYVQIMEQKPQVALPIIPAPPLTTVELIISGNKEITVTDQARMLSWTSDTAPKLEDLQSGTQMLVWTDLNGTVTQLLLFPYAYRGTFSLEDDQITVDHQPLVQKARTVNGQVYLPIRAMAEAVGCTVRWDAQLGAVVEDGDSSIFSVRPGAESAQSPKGEHPLAAPCLFDRGVTYLSAKDLTALLELFQA